MEETESSPVSQIVRENKIRAKKLKFIDATICKISGPNNDFLDKIIAYLAVAFKIEPTSAKMFNDESKQFFQFFKVEPKEEV